MSNLPSISLNCPRRNRRSLPSRRKPMSDNCISIGNRKLAIGNGKKEIGNQHSNDPLQTPLLPARLHPSDSSRHVRARHLSLSRHAKLVSPANRHHRADQRRRQSRRSKTSRSIQLGRQRPGTASPNSAWHHQHARAPGRPQNHHLRRRRNQFLHQQLENPRRIPAPACASRVFHRWSASSSENDAIILAGQSPELHTLASAEFDPRIDADGNLHLDLAALRAGRLPVPLSAVSTHLRRLQSLLREQLILQQPTVNIDPALTANRSALAAGWLRLLLSAMNNQPCDPVLLIPFDISNLRRGMPAKLTAMKVVEGEITLTVEPIPAADRKALIDRLKQPYEAAAE